MVVFGIGVDFLFFKGHFISGNALLDVFGVELLQGALQVLVFSEAHFLEQQPVFDVVNVQVLRLAASEQVISARRVLEALDVLGALVVVCRDLAEVTPSALNL